ncbi:hypothetical protein ACJX0J_019869, partial [Zea mays]
IEQQNDGSSVNVSVNVEEPAAAEEDKVAPTDGAATDGDNDTAAPATDSQAGSDDKPLEAAAEAPQPESDAAAVAQEISRMIEVPNSRVGVLIGKAGETIRNLQMSSGAKIQITKDADADSNALTRPVELVGTLGSVDKAELLIKSVIAEAEAGGSPALIARGFGSGQPGSEQFEMTVPDNKVGLIIGKGGDAIKGMQTKSGARIQLIPQHPPEGVTLTERIVRVTGNKKQIELAKDLIKQAMNQSICVFSSNFAASINDVKFIWDFPHLSPLTIAFNLDTIVFSIEAVYVYEMHLYADILNALALCFSAVELQHTLLLMGKRTCGGEGEVEDVDGDSRVV